MKRNRRGGTLLYCFSPPVMLATFCIEIGLLIYVVMRYKMKPPTRLIVAVLFCLALFQLAEYFVCGGLGTSAEMWSRIGFVAITLLPPLGVHFMRVVSGRGWQGFTWLAYASAAVWIGFFAFGKQTFDNHVCVGNYVIFHLNEGIGGVYFVYYYGWLIFTIISLAYYARSATKHIQAALMLQIFGYLAFILPAMLANTLDTVTISSLPSLMCGFAIIYAATLVFGILPRLRVSERQTPKHSSVAKRSKK